MSLTFNGKPYKSGDIEKSLLKQAKEILAREMQQRIGSIRDPDTGEFPVVVVRGNKIDDLRASIEASPQLINLVRERLPLEDAAMIEFIEPRTLENPTAFLSYTSEDRALAEIVANALQTAGIETWWDRWEISAGDSIVQKINEGLGNCSHFIVLLTPNSIEKPWVQTEMDAAFIRKVDGEAKFIALRSALPADRLPTLLRPLHSPEFVPGSEESIKQLISDIFAFTRKPALGQRPNAVNQPASPYSSAAMAVAEYFCKNTQHAVWGDPQISEEYLAKSVGLSLDDTKDALYELRHFFRESHFDIMPDKNLWSEFDKYFIDGADPVQDAIQIATDLLNDPEFPSSLPQIAEKFGWTERRLNPAVAYLLERKLVDDSHYMGTGDWVTSQIRKSDSTRRFVKSRNPQ